MKLQSIQLDFAPSRFIGSQQSLIVLLASGLALVFAVMGYSYWTDREQESAAQKAAMEKKLGLVPAATSRASGRNNPSLAATISTEVRRPWSRLLLDLENSLGEGIALLRVEPNPKTQEVLLVGVGVRMEDIANFIQRLNQTTSLRNSRMTTQRVLESATDGQLEFTIIANWTEAK